MRVDLIAFLKAHNIEFKGPNERGYVSTKCYNCGKAKKLEVSVADDEVYGIKKGRVKCWSCGANSIVEFYCSVSGVSESEAKRILFGGKKAKDEDDLQEIKFTNEIVNESPKKRERIKDIIEKYDEVPLPMYTEKLTLDGNQDAIKYLEGRGIDRDTISKLDIYTPIFKDAQELLNLLKRDKIHLTKEEFRKLLSFANRVIFPIEMNEKNYGYVARDYSGVPGRLKVLNSSGPLTYAFVYNFDVIKKSEILVLNEGIFDSIKCGPNRAGALLGKAPADNSDKMKILLGLNPEEVVVYLDNGAIPEAMRICRLFSTKVLTKIVVTRPILNATPSADCLEMVKKIVPIHQEGDEFLMSPRNLRILKDFNDCIGAENPFAEFAKKFKIDRYKKEVENAKKLNDLADRYKKLSTNYRASITKILSEVKKWDFVDAGDRKISENDRLIKEADVFNPNFDYEYIEKIYDF